jgi:hypothetical protein
MTRPRFGTVVHSFTDHGKVALMSIHCVARSRFCLAALLCLVASNARADVVLKWSGKPGETFKYTYTQAHENKYTIQGLAHTSKSDLSVDMTWTVKSVAGDGSVEIGLVADRVRLKITADGRIIAYDSGDKDAPGGPDVELFRKLYDAMIGKSYTIKISAQGDVLEVKIPDAVVAAVGSTPFAATADTGSFHSATGVKNMLSQIMPTLPKAPAGQGATWKSDITLPGPSTMLLQYVYTVNDPSPVAQFQAKIVTSIDSPADAPTRIKMNQQTGTGKFTFDTKRGHFTEAEINQSFDMTIKDSEKEVRQTIVLAQKLKIIP